MNFLAIFQNNLYVCTAIIKEYCCVKYTNNEFETMLREIFESTEVFMRFIELSKMALTKKNFFKEQ